MRKIDATLVEKAKSYVTKLLDTELSKDCLFHTKKHTLDVVRNAEVIANYAKLSEDSKNLLRISFPFIIWSSSNILIISTLHPA